MFCSVGWPLLGAAGFFCNLDILYGGLGIGKLQFLIKKSNFSSAVIKALDPDPYWFPASTSGSGSGSGKNGTDPKHCLVHDVFTGTSVSIGFLETGI
jgi:hypothetical protein